MEKRKKLLFWLLGGTFAFACVFGLFLLLVPKVLSISAASVIICLSLASGLIAPNPLSLVGLIAGICMLVFPAKIVGGIFLIGGLCGMTVNYMIARKKA